MANDTDSPKPLRDGLLKANGLSTSGPPNDDRKQARRLLERQRSKQTRSRRIVVGMWIAVAVLYVAVAIGQFFLNGSSTDWLANALSAFGIAACLLFFASIYATIRHWMAGRSLNQREVICHLTRIEALLEGGRKPETTSPPGEDPSES